MTAQEASTQSPAAQPVTQASEGDALLVLDDGQTVQVHSLLLALHSAVLKDAIQLAQGAQHEVLRVPLPSTPASEAVALVKVLYSKTPESHILGLPLEHLCKLANICHRFALGDCLTLVDQALAKHTAECCPVLLRAQAQSEQYLRSDNVVNLYWDACAKGMENSKAACATFIGAHVREVAAAASKDLLGPVLLEIARLQLPGSNDVRDSDVRADLYEALQHVRNAITFLSRDDAAASYCQQSEACLSRALRTLSNS